MKIARHSRHTNECRGGRTAIATSVCFFFSSRRRHTRCLSDWSSDVCSSDLYGKIYHVAGEPSRLSPGYWVDHAEELPGGAVAAALAGGAAATGRPWRL